MGKAQKESSVQVKEQEKAMDSKLMNSQALDEILNSKHVEISKLEEQIFQLNTQLHVLELEISTKKGNLAEELQLRRNSLEDELVDLKTKLMVQEKEQELIQTGLIDREVQLAIKEQEAAEFEEKRKPWEAKALYIEQTEMVIQERLQEADGIKKEYEAQLESLIKLQSEAEIDKQRAASLESKCQERSGLLDQRERIVSQRELALEAAKEGFKEKISANGKL